MTFYERSSLTRVDDKPQSKYMNVLNSTPMINSRQNIIAGPEKLDYFFHSGGAQMPLLNTNGPFPVQGNIGALLKQEALSNFQDCVAGPDISGSPNCTGAFNKDQYTRENTCGANCLMKYPESYGLKDFGFAEDDKVKLSNAHQVHAFQNLRAGMPAQTSDTGCYEWLPNMSGNSIGTCEMNQDKTFSQVGEWNKLPNYSNLETSSTLVKDIPGNNFSTWTF